MAAPLKPYELSPALSGECRPDVSPTFLKDKYNDE